MSGKVEAPKKFKVTKVQIRREASASNDLKESGSKADLKKLLQGVAKMGNRAMKVKDGKSSVPGRPWTGIQGISRARIGSSTLKKAPVRSIVFF